MEEAEVVVSSFSCLIADGDGDGEVHEGVVCCACGVTCQAAEFGGELALQPVHDDGVVLVCVALPFPRPSRDFALAINL